MKLSEYQLYAIGFNSGYIIAQYLPVLMKTMIKGIKSKGRFYIGLLAGSQEYEKERESIRINELDKMRSKSPRNRDRDLN